MIGAASGIPTAGLWRYVIPQMVAGRYYSTAANAWDELLVPHASGWLTPQTQEAAEKV
jgi:hypothetical protein